MCTSLQGPQGPTSPISQKLSFLPKRSTRSGGSGVSSSQSFSASVSAGTPSAALPLNTVTWRRSGGRPHTSTSSSPGPADGFAFEVITEGPVPEHLEEGVVVVVAADVFQIVVFAAGADAFLRVHRAAVRTAAFLQKHVLKLVHAGVCEEQGGVVQRTTGAERTR